MTTPKSVAPMKSLLDSPNFSPVFPSLSKLQRILYIYAIYQGAARVVGPTRQGYAKIYGNLAGGVAVAFQIFYDASREGIDKMADSLVSQIGQEQFLKDVTHLVQVTRAETKGAGNA
jgi:hypothetical protein